VYNASPAVPSEEQKMRLLNLLTTWHFDPITAFFTILLAPLLVLALRIIGKNLQAWLRYSIEGGLYWLSRYVVHSLAGTLSLKRYCRLQLETESKYLYVPSLQDVKVEIDDVFVTLTLEQQVVKRQVTAIETSPPSGIESELSGTLGRASHPS
jgi:hypothetical protein